jgi:hypothetical protein
MRKCAVEIQLYEVFTSILWGVEFCMCTKTLGANFSLMRQPTKFLFWN